jgi:cytochrome c
MDDRFNTIAGWTLGAGIVFLGAWLVTGELFHSSVPTRWAIRSPASRIRKARRRPSSRSPTSSRPPDVARGQSQFAKCQGCHTINQGGAGGQGPNLWGRMGAPIASVAGYAYSEALRGKAGGTWTWDEMSAWLQRPHATRPARRWAMPG